MKSKIVLKVCLVLITFTIQLYAIQNKGNSMIEQKIKKYVSESVLYLKNHSYKEYLEKYAFNKKEIDKVAKTLHTTIDYKAIVNTRDELYHYFSNEIKKKKFKLEEMEIDTIGVEELNKNGLLMYEAEVTVSTLGHVAVFDVKVLPIDNHILRVDGMLDFNIVKTKTKNLYISDSIDTTIYDSLSRYEKACKTSENENYRQEKNDKASLEEIRQSEKRLHTTFPSALIDYWYRVSNGDKRKRDYDSFELFSHQNIMGIADFYNYYWNDIQGVKTDVFTSHTYTQEEKKFIKDINENYFVFAVDWKSDLNFMDILIFNKKHNCYGFVFDQDVDLLSYIKDIENGKHVQYDDILQFMTGYINTLISENIDEDNDISIYNYFLRNSKG